MPKYTGQRRGRRAGRRRQTTRGSLMPAGSILVADDDAAIRTVLNQALSRAGYEVRSTGNAATLWRWISQGDGDLVITDVVMPDESAFDLLPRIKKVAAGSADHHHERAEHVHDRDPRLRARRLRISAEAVRPEGTDRDRRPRAVGAEGEGAAAGQDRGLRIDSAGRPLAGDAGNLPRAGAADADRPHGDDLRRVRHRQGTGGARAARLRQAAHRPVRRHQHGGDPARPDRVANCSATRRAPSPAPIRAAPAASSRPKAARCSSTKSATCRWRRRRGCCACCSRANTPRSAAARRSRPTCASSPRPTRICASSSSRVCSARICSSASTSCRCACRRCASAPRTSPI